MNLDFIASFTLFRLPEQNDLNNQIKDLNIPLPKKTVNVTSNDEPGVLKTPGAKIRIVKT